MALDIQKLKRTGAVTLPSLFTIGNMAFGFFSILSAVDKEFSRAGWFIIGSMIMDMLDGRVARLVNGESKFGIEMDSLSDFISFGVAPAVIMYLFQLKDYGFWGYPVVFIYAMCGGLRLARFNVLSHEGKSSKQYFAGLPIPMAAGILASFVIVYSLLETSVPARSVVLGQMPFVYNSIPLIMLGLGILMVSQVPYAAFKQHNIIRPKTLKGLVLLIALIFLVLRYPQDSIFLLFSAYVASGIIAALWRAFKSLGNRKEIPAVPPVQ